MLKEAVDTQEYVTKSIEVAQRENMVERIAMLLEPHIFTDDPIHGVLGACQSCAEDRDYIRQKAIVILKAMREPTLAMRKVCTFEEAEITWPAMIDAAIAHVRKEL